MKKFTYRCCLFAMFMSVLGMIICIASAVSPDSYHPLWTLSALLFGVRAVGMAFLSNIFKTGVKGWKEEEASDNIRGNRSELTEIELEEEITINVETEVESDEVH